MQEDVIVSPTIQENTVRLVSAGNVRCDVCIIYSHFFTDLNPCAHITPCQNGGNCSNGDPSQYNCVCSPGFTGMECEEDIDECDMSPCGNNGTCIVSG